MTQLHREKGDASKARDYLPADRQYLVTRGGEPCSLVLFPYPPIGSSPRYMRLPNTRIYVYTYTTVPCLRRAASLQYTDADEDAERLLSFGEGSTAPDGDEWVETHAGRKVGPDAHAQLGEIDDIPDVDGPTDSATSGLANLSISGGKGGDVETPDLDEIPDMEEDLEDEDDEATAAPQPPPKVVNNAEP